MSFLKERVAKASTLHSFGIEVKKILERVKSDIHEALGALSEKIIFTSGCIKVNDLTIQKMGFAI